MLTPTPSPVQASEPHGSPAAPPAPGCHGPLPSPGPGQPGSGWKPGPLAAKPTHSRPLLLPWAGLLTQLNEPPRVPYVSSTGWSFLRVFPELLGTTFRASCNPGVFTQSRALGSTRGKGLLFLGPPSLPLCLTSPQSESYPRGENFSKKGLRASRLILKEETRVCREPWGVCRLVGRLVCKGALAAEGGAPGPTGHGGGHSHRSLGPTLLTRKAGLFLGFFWPRGGLWDLSSPTRS